MKKFKELKKKLKIYTFMSTIVISGVREIVVEQITAISTK